LKTILHNEQRRNSIYQVKDVRKKRSLEGEGAFVHHLSIKGYKDEMVRSAIEDAMRIEKQSTLEFTFSIGNMLFTKQGDSAHAEISLPVDQNGNISGRELENRKLRQFWCTTISDSMAARLTKCLEDNGFVCINKDKPDSFINMHLFFKKDQLLASVVMANDKEEIRTQDQKLTALAKAKQDKRECKGSSYFLAEAFGGLSVEEKKDPREKEDNPPIVTSVITQKDKLCTLSMITDNTLDIRANLRTYHKEQTGCGLPDGVLSTLMDCWRNRDEEGRIAEPDQQTGITMKLLKHVDQKLIFLKEIEMDGHAELLEVNIFRIRSKLLHSEWRNILEVDINLGGQSNLTVDEMTKRFLYVKNWWSNFQY